MSYYYYNNISKFTKFNKQNTRNKIQEKTYILHASLCTEYDISVSYLDDISVFIFKKFKTENWLQPVFLMSRRTQPCLKA